MAPSAERHLHIVPWNNTAELLWVKRAFFPEEGAEDERAAALAKVAAWATRTKLPHGMDSTAAITSALLADVPGMPTLTLRLLYSTAFCRFVNGLLDPMQRGAFAIPMHTLARELGLPASFVELRHAASHEDLPSISVFRESSRRALQYLWGSYWSKLEESADVSETSLRKVRDVLKTWRRLRRSNPGASVVLSGELEQVVKECIVYARDERELLIEAFLEEKALIPAGEKKSNLMKGAVSLWKPLLQLIDVTIGDFTEELLSEILDILKMTDAESEGLVDEELYNALEYWALEIISGISSNSTSTSPVSLDVEDIAEQCIAQPNRWTISILRKMVDQLPALAKFRSLLKDSSMVLSQTKFDGPKGAEISIEDAEKDLGQTMARFHNIQRTVDRSVNSSASYKSQGRTSTGWRQWEGAWEPRPIGKI